jgi:hypothetical protein
MIFIISLTQPASLGSLNSLSIELKPTLDKLLKLGKLELEDLLDTISGWFTSSLIRRVKFQKLPDKKFYRVIISTLLTSNEKLILAYKKMKFHEFSLPASMLFEFNSIEI